MKRSSCGRAEHLIVVLLAASACTSVEVIRGPAAGGLDPERVGVLAFSYHDRGDAEVVADGCGAGLLEAQIRTVERRETDAIAEEKSESRSGEQGAEYYQRLGELTGADAFITGGISGGTITARLVSAKTGEVIKLANLKAGFDAGGPFAAGRKVCRALLGSANE